MTTTTGLSRRKLDTSQRMQVIALMARGDTFAEINAYLLEHFGVTLNPKTLTDMKKVHGDTIALMQRTHEEAETADAAQLLIRTRRLIGRKLTRAERDAKDLADLDYQRREGEITEADYHQRRTGLIEMSIQELVTVSKEMHSESSKPLGGELLPGLPDGGGNSNLALTEALLNAIKTGNHVEIQRLILRSPNETDNVVPQPVQG